MCRSAPLIAYSTYGTIISSHCHSLTQPDVLQAANMNIQVTFETRAV